MYKELTVELTKAIGYIKKTDYLWVGIVECKTAKKYKYEVLWFYGADHYDFEEPVDNQIENAETRMCKDLKEAYAYGFDAIRKTLIEDPKIEVVITDLVAKYEEE